MSWAGDDWTVGLTGHVLQKVKQLQAQNEKLNKERQQRQLQLDNSEAALHKQKQKVSSDGLIMSYVHVHFNPVKPDILWNNNLIYWINCIFIELLEKMCFLLSIIFDASGFLWLIIWSSHSRRKNTSVLFRGPNCEKKKYAKRNSDIFECKTIKYV